MLYLDVYPLQTICKNLTHSVKNTKLEYLFLIYEVNVISMVIYYYIFSMELIYKYTYSISYFLLHVNCYTTTLY